MSKKSRGGQPAAARHRKNIRRLMANAPPTKEWLDSYSKELRKSGMKPSKIKSKRMKIIQSSYERIAKDELESLSRQLVGRHSALPERVNSSGHKQRPTIRQINGTSWRLAGTASEENTFEEQVAVSIALAKQIRATGSKARVIKWKNQAGVYYQKGIDPIEAIWGDDKMRFAAANGLLPKRGQLAGRHNPTSLIETTIPTSYQWLPAEYGRKAEKSYNAKRNNRNIQNFLVTYGVNDEWQTRKEIFNRMLDSERILSGNFTNKSTAAQLQLLVKSGVIETYTPEEGTWDERNTPQFRLIPGGLEYLKKENESERERFQRANQYDRKESDVMAGEYYAKSHGLNDAKRKLLVIHRPGGEKVSVGWVTRKEAAELLFDAGIYPIASEFDAEFEKENPTLDFSLTGRLNRGLGFKRAEEQAKERERFKEEKANSEGAAAEQKWQILDDYIMQRGGIPTQAHHDPSGGLNTQHQQDQWDWLLQYNEQIRKDLWMNSRGHLTLTKDMEKGLLKDYSPAPDFYEAFYKMLSEDGHDEETIDWIFEQTPFEDIMQLFHYEPGEIYVDGKLIAGIPIQRISGERDGKQLGEWNDFEPISNPALRIKTPIEIKNLNDEGLTAAKELIWNMEFGRPKKAID